MIYSSHYTSPMGDLTLASDGERLVGVWVAGQKYFASDYSKPFHPQDNLPIFDLTKRWLDEYFSAKKPRLSVMQLAPKGSDFRHHVWSALCNIPYGETITYGQLAQIIAKRMNKPSMASQAIGGAVGHNPISIIIPCHRVVGAQKSLTGYAGGLAMKRQLLMLEGVEVSHYKTPEPTY